VEHALASLLGRFTYLAIVLVLSAAGLGAPISEDLVLLLSGALSARGVTDFWPTLCAGYGGVVIGDLLIHQWGKRLGPRAYEHRLVRKVLSVERQEKLRAHFVKHGGLTVVVGRHTPGLRAPIFFLSGASGVGFWKFLLCDALSAAVTVPIVVTLGHYFGDHLDVVRSRIHEVQWLVAAAAVLALGGYLYLRRRRRLRAEALASRAGRSVEETGAEDSRRPAS
jgi:membrane protein DedA with SNARE-associated domain